MSGKVSNSLTGEHALVTGGSRGIGLAIVRELLGEGAAVSFTAKDPDRLASTEKNLREEGYGELFSKAADVTDEKQVKAAFSASVKAFGEVTILVNNAGAVDSSPFSKLSFSDWQHAIDLNLSSVYLFCCLALPPMLKAGRGRIINMASTAGLKGYPYVSAYCAAKHGVIGLTRAMALEVAAGGVTANAICPGYTDTDLVGTSIDRISKKTGRSPAEIEEEFLKDIPQKRFVKPDEIASAVSWLCRPEQASVNGHALVIDGGETSG